MTDQKHMWDKYAEGYDRTVFSLTKFPERRKQMLTPAMGRHVLNLGCGSAPYLNRGLVRINSIITATDYCEKMITVAKRVFSHPLLKYIVADSRKLPFPNCSFDSVISSNSILPPERREIDIMVGEVLRVLRENGVFVAFLPSFDSVLQAIRKLGLEIRTDNSQLRVIDTVGDWQCFHTPESIKVMMKNAGFQRYSIKRVFLRTRAEIEELKRLYGVDTSRSYIYEYLVVGHKSV